MLKRILPLSSKILLRPRSSQICLNIASQQYLSHNIMRFLFSTQKPSKIQMEVYEWRALCAYYVFKRIIELSKTQITSFGSIRQEIADQQKISKYILKTIKETTRLQYSTIEELGLGKRQLSSVIGAFQFDKAIQIAYQVWQHQLRFVEAQIDYKMVLNPQPHSGEILLNLIKSESGRIISGQKGVGKSFSYLLYSHLSSFIIDCRIQRYFQTKKKNDTLYKFVKQSEINQFPYLMYFPLLQTISNWKIYESFRVQVPLKCKVSQKPSYEGDQTLNYVSKQLQNIRSFLYGIKENPIEGKFNSNDDKSKSISGKFSGIKLLFVADEANNYFSQVRTLMQKMRNNKQYQVKKKQYQEDPKNFKSQLQGQKYINKKLKRYSDFLDGVQQQCIVVLNSSQDAEASLVKQWNLLCKPRLFDVYRHQQKPSSNVQVQYTKYTFSKLGNLELYNVMWFEIQKNLRVMLSIQNHNSISSIRQLFIEAFQLITEPTSQKKQINTKWKTDVAPLHIRQNIQRKDFQQNIKIFDGSSGEISQIQKQKIKSFFIGLKTKIEEYRFSQKQLVSFESYLRKGDTILKQSIRYEILANLYLQVLRVCFSQQNKQNTFIFSYASLIEKYAEQHWALNEIQNFALFLGQGANYKDSKTILFMIKPLLMRQMLKFLSTINMNYQNYYKIISYGGFPPQLAGFLLDNLYYYLFRISHFNFSYTTYRATRNKQKKVQLIASKQSYQIKESIPIQPIASFDSEFEIDKQLNNLIAKSLLNPDQSFLGYIASKIPNQSGSKVLSNKQQYLYQSKNGFFDFAIVTYYSIQQQLKIRLIDNTVGHLQSKISRANKKKDIIWSKIDKVNKENYKMFMIEVIALGPTLNLQKYLANNKREQEEVNIIQTRGNSSCQIFVACFDEKDPKNHFTIPNPDIVEEGSIQNCFHSLINGLHDYKRKDQLILLQKIAKQKQINNNKSSSINEQNIEAKVDKTK